MNVFVFQELIDSGAIGDVIHIQHFEPVRIQPGQQNMPMYTCLLLYAYTCNEVVVSLSTYYCL